MGTINLKNGQVVSGDNIRMVCANLHHDSGEIEVVLEIEPNSTSLLSNKTELKSIWLDKEALLQIIDGQIKL